MAWRLANNIRTLAIDIIVDALDAGAGAGTIGIRTGAVPTNVADADTGTLLGTLTGSDPFFGAGSNGVAAASAITSDTNADASGTAAHGRMKDSTPTIHSDFTISTSGADVNFNNITIVAGGTIAMSSLTATQNISV